MVTTGYIQTKRPNPRAVPSGHGRFIVISERAKRASSVMFVFNRDFRYVRIYIYMYIYMWPYVNLYVHARWNVMWDELSVDPFLNHSNQLKPTLKMF